MPNIYVCFLWHMHQPFYKDLLSGEYRLPWTRMHALKDYYGMVSVLREYPDIHQTFNVVPSMLVQLDEYAAGTAADPFLRAALKPAETLTEDEQAFILRYFFQANPARLIQRHPRYSELFEAWRAADYKVSRARRFFGMQALRDLQVLSQLAWFDEEYLNDPEVSELIRKGRDYTLEDQALMGRKQMEILRSVSPIYAEFAARGQIEISTTPFYHPILPLLCDSNIAEIAHPYVPLPSRFRYPEDARRHLESARSFMAERFGREPDGLWPSEGSVSDEALRIAAETGFRWFASDNGVLGRTLGRNAGVAETYQPYVWRQDGRELRAIFRDHYLSDLIGFVYARMGAVEAATHFLERIHENCRAVLGQGRDALVPVILDGENAWEYYEQNGRPFLRELYQRIQDDPQIRAVTVSEALALIEPHELGHIFPGSWINANFDIWIGAEEDNKAWEMLLRARQAYDHAVNGPDAALIPEADRKMAYEELLIAEGSDWCWWYGPEHDSENRPEFDTLYRDHLANVYRLLRLTPPEELSRPILRLAAREFHQAPTGPVKPTIDGVVTSYFEWLGAGLYRVDQRSGAMHGHRYLVRAMHYGSDGTNLFVRLDFEEDSLASLTGMKARLVARHVHESTWPASVTVQFERGSAVIADVRLAAAQVEPEVECAFHRVLELRIPLAALNVAHGYPVQFQVSLWQDGLPMDALPQQGWIEFSTAEPSEWPL